MVRNENQWIDENLIDNYLDTFLWLTNEQKNILRQINSTSEWLIFWAGSLEYKELRNDWGPRQLVSSDLEGFQNSLGQHVPRFASYEPNNDLKRVFKGLARSVQEDLEIKIVKTLS
jgi:hypothetical protein